MVLSAGLILGVGVMVTGQDALVGTWQGTLMVPPAPVKVGLVVTSDGGADRAVLVAVDDNGRIPVQAITLTGGAVHLDVPAIRGTYDGTLSANRQDITGTWSQGMPATLNFTRVDHLDAPATFGEPEKTAVVTTVNAYFDGFTRKDWTAFRACFQPPYMMWAVGTPPNTFATLDDIVTRYQGVRAPLDNVDYAVSRAAQVTVRPLTITSALADVHWRRDKRDGSLLSEGAEILTLVKTAAGWKINGNIAERLDQYGKSF
jgi:hypothetical protein